LNNPFSPGRRAQIFGYIISGYQRPVQYH
jgi:hypothetical protein